MRKMKVELISDFDETDWKVNRVYLADKICTTPDGITDRHRIWDAEVECKKPETALKRLSEAVPELSWIKDMGDELLIGAEPEHLSYEYDCYTYEVFEGTVYVSAHMWGDPEHYDERC